MSAMIPELERDDQPAHDDSMQTSSLVPVPDLTGYTELRVLAEVFHQSQEHRKRIANLTRQSSPEFAVFVELASAAEKDAGKALVAQYRQTAPAGVITWQKESKGIGEHLCARLLGHLGHPRVALPFHWEEGKPPQDHECDPLRCGKGRHLVAEQPFLRTVSQLWAYCGHGDPERKRKKGMTAEDATRLGSPTLKMLVWNLACASMKCRPTEVDTKPVHASSGGISPRPTVPSPDPEVPASVDSPPTKSDSNPISDTSAGVSSPDPNSHAHPGDETGQGDGGTANGQVSVEPQSWHAVWPYRLVYEQRRRDTVDRDWSDGHKHADALRITGKTILKDLWIAAD